MKIDELIVDESYMAQRISGFYRLVTLPRFYKALGFLLQEKQARKRIVADLIKPSAGMTVLDCGCGPASLLPYLEGVDYTGIDVNPRHIDFARNHYRDKGCFIVGNAIRDIAELFPCRFNLVIASGLLHHLSDADASHLLSTLTQLIKIGERIVTLDPAWLPHQNPIAWALNKLDSGQNVRTAEGYLALAESLPLKVETRIYRDLLPVPYDHFSMTLTKLA